MPNLGRILYIMLQVVSTWAEAIFVLVELLPGHPSLPALRVPKTKGSQLPRRLWGQKKKQEHVEGWPVE